MDLFQSTEEGHRTPLSGAVLQIASGDLWAGAENQIWQLSRALVDLGVDVRALLLNEGELGRRLRDAGISVVVLDERHFGFPALLRRAVAEFRRIRPVVVHSHRGKDMALVSIGAWAMGCAHVRTLHGAAEFQRRTLRSRLAGALESFSYRRLDAVVEVAPQLAASVPSRPERRYRIANGIDPDALREAAHPPAPLPPAPDGRVALVGRLVAVKRPDRFLEVLARLRANGLDVRGLIVGDGPLRNECVAHAQRMGLESYLDLVGNQNAPARWLTQADVLMVCSEHEGLPMVVLEAMALGTPVVAPPLGAIPEVLDEGRAGIVTTSAAPDVLAAAAAQLLTDREMATRLQQRAYRRVVERYSNRVSAERYLALYRDLLPQQGVIRTPPPVSQER